MIRFHAEFNFTLPEEKAVTGWLESVIRELGFHTGEINYIFTDDAYLSRLNVRYLQHDTLTDIISFDYTEGKVMSGDIFISIPRVRENARIFDTGFTDELHRVMVHGLLHYSGLQDKTPAEKKIMRAREDYYLSLRGF